jgi:hypothetical protein
MIAVPSQSRKLGGGRNNILYNSLFNSLMLPAHEHQGERIDSLCLDIDTVYNDVDCVGM